MLDRLQVNQNAAQHGAVAAVFAALQEPGVSKGHELAALRTCLRSSSRVDRFLIETFQKGNN